MRIIDVLTGQATTTSNPVANAAPKINVHNLIILDESGSMGCIKTAAIKGVNSTLDTIRQSQAENPNQRHTVSMVTFNTLQQKLIYGKKPINEVSSLTEREYIPDGCTPLYDAMGTSLNGLRRRISDKDVVLVTIITDGMENASTRYNAYTIKKLVEELKALNWVFTYIGANQDAYEVGAQMAIDNNLNWDYSEEGTKEMFVKENESRLTFMSKLKSMDNIEELKKSYFKK